MKYKEAGSSDGFLHFGNHAKKRACFDLERSSVYRGDIGMLTVRPAFYDDFQCLASECRHSCCMGWEIDIDEETLDYYQTIKGPLGKELESCIVLQPTPHFCLTEQEHCPFLRGDGLCRLICELGEDALCDICALHPRFYNEYPERVEMGLGLCCEEAVRLLLENKGALRLIYEQDGAEAEEKLTLLAHRERIFEVLADTSMPVEKRFISAAGIFEQDLMIFDAQETADFFLALEHMDSTWTEMLQRLKHSLPCVIQINKERYTRIASYLVYRHFRLDGTEGEGAIQLQFCLYATRLICALEAFSDEALRLFSAEIEYSDENVEKICIWIRNKIDEDNEDQSPGL